MRVKNLERKLERKNSKRTISSSGGLELLQIVSESDTGRCANERVDCEISHQLESGTKHSL